MSTCTDCQNFGNGRCRKCDGTGHDQLTEGLSNLLTLGIDRLRAKVDCEECYGTGQCQTCGGTGEVSD